MPTRTRNIRLRSCAGLLVAVCSLICATSNAQNVPVDVSAYSPLCGVAVRSEENRISIAWPMSDGEFGRVRLNLNSGKPLIESLGIAKGATGKAEPILHDIEPV